MCGPWQPEPSFGRAAQPSCVRGSFSCLIPAFCHPWPPSASARPPCSSLRVRFRRQWRKSPRWHAGNRPKVILENPGVIINPLVSLILALLMCVLNKPHHTSSQLYLPLFILMYAGWCGYSQSGFGSSYYSARHTSHSYSLSILTPLQAPSVFFYLLHSRYSSYTVCRLLWISFPPFIQAFQVNLIIVRLQENTLMLFR